MGKLVKSGKWKLTTTVLNGTEDQAKKNERERKK